MICTYFDNTETVVVTINITIVKTMKFLSDISVFADIKKYININVNLNFSLKNLLEIKRVSDTLNRRKILSRTAKVNSNYI